MKLIAIMPVRNEDWILGFSARVALMWCDALVALNHCSTDNTQRILDELSEEYKGRVLSALEVHRDWREMEHRQMLLTIARNYEATHIALVDADEVLCANSLPLVRGRAEVLKPGQCLTVAMHCMWRGLHQYRTDPGSVWSNRKDLALVCCDAPRLEFATRADGYQHHARAPRFSRAVPAPDIGVMHLQFADWRRLTAKHALYKVRERIAFPAWPASQIDSMYSQALDERSIQVTATPPEWLAAYQDITQYVNFKAVPWQEGETEWLYRQHKPEMFAGLNLFGVVR
jgi:hypothetical protein